MSIQVQSYIYACKKSCNSLAEKCQTTLYVKKAMGGLHEGMERATNLLVACRLSQPIAEEVHTFLVTVSEVAVVSTLRGASFTYPSIWVKKSGGKLSSFGNWTDLFSSSIDSTCL